MVRKSTILPETDGWDEDAAAHPAIRRIHRLFLFFGFFFLIAALIAGFFYIPAKIVKKYPSGGKRVYYVNRLFYYIRGDHLQQHRWTDTLYDTEGSVICSVDVDRLFRTSMHTWDITLDEYDQSGLFYYNENTSATPETIDVIINALSEDGDHGLYTWYYRGKFEDIAQRMADADNITVVSALINTTRHANSDVRCWSLSGLSNCPNRPEFDEIIIPALIERIDDEDDKVVYAAMGALASYRKPELLPHILRGYNKIVEQRSILNEGSYIEMLANVGSVEEAIAEISRIKTASKSYLIIRYDIALLALNPETREQAYQMLSAPPLQQNLEYDNIDFMTDILLRVDPKRTTDFLVNSSIPLVLPRSMSKIKYSPETIPFFQKCLEQGNLHTKHESLRILMRMRALDSAPNILDSASNILITYLSNPNEYYRYSAVVNLGRIGDPSVIPQLDSIAKNDPDRYIRRAATDALIRLRNNQ